MVPLIPENAPFTAGQRAWLNGFLAGLLSKGEPAVASPVPVAAQEQLLIAFGSQSGNAESLAKRLARDAAGRGFGAQAAGLDSLQPADLARAKNVLLITSTWGEGDMPDNAAAFWTALNQNGSSPDLTGVRYGVLALGDRNYADTFCFAGRRFDERLAELGAQRVQDRAECDVEFEQTATEWSNRFFASLNSANGTTDPPAAVETGLSHTPEPVYDRRNPFPARFLGNVRITAPCSAKDVRHIVLSLAGSGLSYEAGDALGVHVQNCPNVVSSVIAAHGFNLNAQVLMPDGSQGSLHEALRFGYEVRHLLGKAPGQAVRLDEFIASLSRLQPRLYSIASSLKAHPGEVHLTVGVVKYEVDGVLHRGAGSTFLAERLPIGATTGVFIHRANHFRLPARGDTPIVMVGPGTGIAPFRAFLEERRAIGATGKNWLFFGDQRRATDFLYHDEVQAWLKSGHLSRLDTAFSRDQAEKIYVQNRMLESADELWRWLEGGAHFYVCGDAKRMARDVDAALHRIIREAGGRSEEAAAEYVTEMKRTKRYARDVY